MAWGIQTWDANGVPNNYGIKPVSVIKTIYLADGATTGSWGFSVPAGSKLGFVFVPNNSTTYYSGRRVISVSGSNIVMTAGTNDSLTQFQSMEAWLVVFLEAA